jgi:hypothetical protein
LALSSGRRLAVLSLVAAWAGSVAHVHAAATIRQETIQFRKGSSEATIKGRLKGDQTEDYRVRAAAGQTLVVALKGTNAQNFFNVLPPGSSDVAMFVGQEGGGFKGILPTDGDYTVRVYLMRPAARRNESSSYTLTVGVTGKPLAPLPAAKDALVPGTPYHATATLTCTPPFESKPQHCEAFVIRRGFDGTATVEVRGANGLKRRILFVKGDPLASDTMDAMTYLRDGDATVVKIAPDEHYAIPDAFVRGG